MSSIAGLLGVVILARHGDRLGFFQDPLTYTASSTSITPLGNAQEFQLGQELRSLYVNTSSPTYVQNMNTTLFDEFQVQVRADNGAERGVIYDSAVSLLQGLFPETTAYNTTLANGTNIVGPLNGYQVVPIDVIDPDEDVSLEGYTDCNTFNDATAAFYNSSAFQQVASENADFLNSLPPFLDGRAVTLENMFNIFDYMNVESIHNASFAARLPAGYLARVQALANYHEYGVFSSPQLDGPGNIAGRAMLPSIITGLQDIANTSNPLRFFYQAISYKPFISLFNMTGVAQTYPDLAGIVNYASAIVWEIRESSSTGGEPMMRLRFKNGTNDTFTTYNMFGQSGDIPISMFIANLAPAAVNTTAQWCIACNNNQDRGCGTCNNPTIVAELAAPKHHKVSLVAAGFIGACVTIALFIVLLGSAAFLGLISFGRRIRGRSPASSIKEKINH